MRVLVCTDFSAAAAAGEREAARRFPGAELVLFHAVDPQLAQVVENLTKLHAEELRRDMMRYADQRMNEVVERLTSQGRRAIPDLVEGDPVACALAAAERHGVEMIVAGIAPGVPIGSFRTALARRAQVAVLLVVEKVR